GCVRTSAACGRRSRYAAGPARRSRAYRRPLNPIMPCTTDSLCSATSACSRARSAQSSHIFLALPPTWSLVRQSSSLSHSLQVAMASVLSLDRRSRGDARARGRLFGVDQGGLRWAVLGRRPVGVALRRRAPMVHGALDGVANVALEVEPL